MQQFNPPTWRERDHIKKIIKKRNHIKEEKEGKRNKLRIRTDMGEQGTAETPTSLGMLRLRRRISTSYHEQS